MRNLSMAISAMLTAIVIGLLVANVASAARAADIEHSKAAQIAALESSFDATDTTTQLSAYQQRYTETYNQLAAAYTALMQRDAQYRDALGRSERTSAEMAGANAALEAKLAQAYQSMQDAQAAISAWSPGPAYVVAAPEPNLTLTTAPATGPAGAVAGPITPPATARPIAAAPTPGPAATQPPAASATQYCHYDANREWHCEDHPW